MRRFRTRNIVTTVMRRSGSDTGTPDTMQTDKGTDSVPSRQTASRSRAGMHHVPQGKIFLRARHGPHPDTSFTPRHIQQHQMQAVPADTSPGCDELDLYIACQFDRPMEASIEANLTSTSNSYLGPGLVFQREQATICSGGAERLSVQLKGSYEWQTGSGRSNIFNSYEVGLNASLAFPQTARPQVRAPHTQRSQLDSGGSRGGSLNRRCFRMARFMPEYHANGTIRGVLRTSSRLSGLHSPG